MRLLVVIVICIFIWECHGPIPDYDREQFDYYVNRVVNSKKIPKEELIYFAVTTDSKLKEYIKHRPTLNHGEKKTISKFKRWINE